MTATGPLAGKTIVVTRPRAQAAALAGGIEASGGHALIHPLLEIAPASNPQALQQACAQRERYALAIFISPNAVDFAVPAILHAGPWPAGLQPAAIGPGTVKALARYGITPCIHPRQRFDSEGLLEESELAAERILGRQVAIFRGNGGRELLADSLAARGAQVDCITCYERRGPSAPPDALMLAWRRQSLDAITLSSSEALRYLHAALDSEGLAYLRQTPLFIPHPRIAENARALGLDKIIETEGADAGILSGLRAHDWAS